MVILNNSQIKGHGKTKSDDFLLFRYRAINDYTLDAFIKDEIWATLPEAFNDPYDSKIVLNEEKIREFIKSKFPQAVLEIESKRLKISPQEVLEQFIQERMRSVEFSKSFGIVSLSQTITSETLWAHYAGNATGFALAYSISEIKEYASGFNEWVCDVLCSNFTEQEKQVFLEYLINPIGQVKYRKRKENLTDKVIDAANAIIEEIHNLSTQSALTQEAEKIACGKSNIDGVLNIFEKALENIFGKIEMLSPAKSRELIDAIFLSKKSDWKYEKEWRVLLWNKNILPPHIDFFKPYFNSSGQGYGLKPQGIFLGEKISEYNKNALYDIAVRKRIPVYCMVTETSSDVLHLVPYEITRKD